LPSQLTPFTLLNNGFRRFQINLFLFIPLNQQRAKLFTNISIPFPSIGDGYILFGSKGKTVSSNSSILYGPSLGISRSQISLSLLGDINHDNSMDLIIGDPVNSAAYVLFGNGNNALSQVTNGFTIKGEQSGSVLGWAVSSAGDFNDDTFVDIMISDWPISRVYILYGRSQDFTDINLLNLNPSYGIRIIGDTKEVKFFGVTLCSVGDFNRDGFDDILVTGSGNAGENIIYLIYGFDPEKKSIVNLDLKGMTASIGIRIIAPARSFAGLSLANLGDINGDRIPDIGIGSLPYRNFGYGDQETYIVYGNSTRKDLFLNDLTTDVGRKVTIGGFALYGVGDVDRDGYNDVMVVDYKQWQQAQHSGIGAFVISIPNSARVSRNPTVSPTVFPSIIPTDRPSSSPTISFVPSFFPSSPTSRPTSIPSSIISLRPTPARIPTIAPTKQETASSRPTFLRSARPSLRPSTSPTVVPTSSKPSIKPLVSPSRKPSRTPSFTPTINRNPTSSPSASPTLALSDGSFVTKEITAGGNYNGTAWKRIIFVIAPPIGSPSSSSQVVITGNDKGRSIYKVLPRANLTLIITNFHNNQDLIDLTAFSGTVASIGEISYRSNPLTLLLPHEQTIVLSSHTSFDLSENNFLFSSSTNSNRNDDNNNDNNGATGVISSLDGLDKRSITMGSILVGLLLLTFICAQFSENSNIEKYKLKKLLEQNIQKPDTRPAVPTVAVGRNGQSALPVTTDDYHESSSNSSRPDDHSSASDSGSDSDRDHDSDSDNRINGVSDIDLTVSLRQSKPFTVRYRENRFPVVPETESSIGSSSLGSSTLDWSYESISKNDDENEKTDIPDHENQLFSNSLPPSISLTMSVIVVEPPHSTEIRVDDGDGSSSLSWNSLSGSSFSSLT
jgi:hypothetical protein